MSGLLSVGFFLFSVVFSLLTFILWTRFALRFFAISSLYPLSQTMVKLTNPWVNPLSQLFKKLKINIKRYDWPCLTLIFLIEIVKYAILSQFFPGAGLSLVQIFVFAAIEMILEPCNLLFYAIIIRVILSWINPGVQNPLANLCFFVTEPLLFQIRKRLPMMAGLDFSPLVALIILKIIPLFITASMPLQLL